MGYCVYYSGEVAVTPSLTETDARTIRAFVNLEPTDETRPLFAAIAGSSEPDLPGYGSLLTVSEERDAIVPEEGESRHGVRLWLKLLIEHFLGPRGYVLNGEVEWDGEDLEDRGRLFIRDNQLEDVEDVTFNAGPSWAPNHFVDDHLKQAIRSLLDSADNAGCSPDLTVVAAAHVDAVRALLPAS